MYTFRKIIRTLCRNVKQSKIPFIFFFFLTTFNLFLYTIQWETGNIFLWMMMSNFIAICKRCTEIFIRFYLMWLDATWIPLANEEFFFSFLSRNEKKNALNNGLLIIYSKALVAEAVDNCMLSFRFVTNLIHIFPFVFFIQFEGDFFSVSSSIIFHVRWRWGEKNSI